MNYKVKVTIDKNQQTIGGTPSGQPVILLENYNEFAPAGTVVVPLNIPGLGSSGSGLLILKYNLIHGFQVVVPEKEQWKLSCRLLEVGESVVIEGVA